MPVNGTGAPVINPSAVSITDWAPYDLRLDDSGGPSPFTSSEGPRRKDWTSRTKEALLCRDEGLRAASGLPAPTGPTGGA